MTTAYMQALHFVEQQTQFHLGFLPTEQSHQRTRRLSHTIRANTAEGIDMILSVDEDIVAVARKSMTAAPYESLVRAMVQSVRTGGRIIFSGCGATGRLSILLEAMWREFWQCVRRDYPELAVDTTGPREDCVVSVMTGGDRALIRSVENFEDYQSFGRRQMADIGVCAKDTVVAISEGGETSSVIGTAWQGVDVGARVFFVFNNPAELLCSRSDRSQRSMASLVDVKPGQVDNRSCEVHQAGWRIYRSAELIQHPKVTSIDLTSGPMAIAGSTRMQATTIEQLVVGSALEITILDLLEAETEPRQRKRLGLVRREPAEYAELFSQVVASLRQPVSIESLAAVAEYEQQLYERRGRVTYFAEGYLLDILTDTTERAPTFMLPPFRPVGDERSCPSWAFLKHPYMSTRQAWTHMLRRRPRALDWDADTYRSLDASDRICCSPPKLGEEEIYRFQIGCEEDASRCDGPDTLAMAILVGQEVSDCLRPQEAFRKGFLRLTESFGSRAILAVGPEQPINVCGHAWCVPCHMPTSPLQLCSHLAVKLVMNTVSTATMARMGRVAGNWMICAEATNKKLIDRGTRLIQSFTGVEYFKACQSLYEVLEESAARNDSEKPPEPPSVLAIRKLKPDCKVLE